MEPFWFFRLRFRWAYYSAYDSDFRFFLGHNGRFPFGQKFRKFRFVAKWKTFFRFARLENSQKKWNCSEGSPVFPVGTSQWKFVFHLQISCLYHQFHAFPGLLSIQAPSCFNKNGGWSWSVFWKLFANKLSGLLRVLCLPRSSAR